MGAEFRLRNIASPLFILASILAAGGLFVASKWQGNVSGWHNNILSFHFNPTETTDILFVATLFLLSLAIIIFVNAISNTICYNKIKIHRTAILIPGFLQTKPIRIPPSEIKDFYITELKKGRHGKLTIVYSNNLKYRVSSKALEYEDEMASLHQCLMILVGDKLDTIKKRVADSKLRTRKINPLYYIWVLVAVPFFMLSLQGFTAGYVYVPNPYDIKHLATLSGHKLPYVASAYGLFGLAFFMYPYLMYYKFTKRTAHYTFTALFIVGGILIRISRFM
jgi:hypothetical protein